MKDTANHGIEGCPYNTCRCVNACVPLSLGEINKFKASQEKDKALFDFHKSLTCMSLYGMCNVQSWCRFCVLYFNDRFDLIRTEGVRACSTHLNYIETCRNEVDDKTSMSGSKKSSLFGLHKGQKVDIKDQVNMYTESNAHDSNIAKRWLLCVKSFKGENREEVSASLASVGIALPGDTHPVMYQNVRADINYGAKAAPCKKRKAEALLSAFDTVPVTCLLESVCDELLFDAYPFLETPLEPPPLL